MLWKREKQCESQWTILKNKNIVTKGNEVKESSELSFEKNTSSAFILDKILPFEKQSDRTSTILQHASVKDQVDEIIFRLLRLEGTDGTIEI